MSRRVERVFRSKRISMCQYYLVTVLPVTKKTVVDYL